MTTINVDMPLGRLVGQFPAAARVLERFEIDYCCGGQRSLAQACREQNLDVKKIRQQLEEAAEPRSGAAAEVNWLERSLTELCDHIEQTHHEYLKSELPRLNDLIAKVVAAHVDRHPELQDVQRVFASSRAELEAHMMKEERILFPAIRQLERANTPTRFPFGSLSNPIRMMEHEHDVVGQALKELRQLTGDFTPPEDACNTYRIMLDALHVLESDLHQHIHKENNILFPRAQELEHVQSE